MSTIDLDAFEAFVDAMNELSGVASGWDIGRVLRHLDNNGWQITRKPIAPPEPIEVPIATPQHPAHVWPPSGVTRLWATNMETDPTAFTQVESIWELNRMAERGATFIDALNESDARLTFTDRATVGTKRINVGDS